MIITKILVNEKTLQTNTAINDPYDARLLDQHSIHCNVGLKCFFQFSKMIVIVIYAYFINISQGSVEMHLPCGGI